MICMFSDDIFPRPLKKEWIFDDVAKIIGEKTQKNNATKLTLSLSTLQRQSKAKQINAMQSYEKLCKQCKAEQRKCSAMQSKAQQSKQM